MGRWLETVRRLAFLIRQSGFERELDAEIQFHLRSRAGELLAAGMTRDDAVAQARREFGSGVRVALGSSTGGIVCLIGREALVLVALGAVAGIVISTLAGYLLAISQLLDYPITQFPDAP